MSKRKFKKGAPVTSLDELFKHDYFIAGGKTLCAGWCRSWQVKMAHDFIKHGSVFVAERLTNEEFYAGKTDDQLEEMLGEELCEFCPMPESQQGVRNYGNGPVFCHESGACEEALAEWKEEYVE